MFFKDKKVLVTGGTGFVGSHFVEELLHQGAQIRVPIHHNPLRINDSRIETMPADLSRMEDCRRVCQGMQYVVHAGGTVAAAAASSAGPMAAISTNLILQVQMLQAAWDEKVERFLLFSSSTGYPDIRRPIKEDEFWTGPTHPTYFGYGWMRRYCERLGEFVHSRGVTKVAIVRPSAIYGRYDNFDPKSGHVVPALIRRALAKEDPFVVWGHKDVVRDFLHVTDLIKGALLLLEKHCECDPVNIGYGEATTIGDIVNLVLKAAGHSNAKVVYDESKPTTIPFRMVDISKARSLLGFAPSVTLADGLRDTVEWYKNTGAQA
jgi:GDP-L-fucose synthase